MELFHRKTAKILIVTLSLLLSPFTINNNLASATTNCVSDACIAAEKAEAEAMEKATNATNAAKTLEGEIAKLEGEITALQARITANQARSNDLKTLIAENTVKLKDQQEALANMLVETHFEGQPEAIMILAGSSSISDYAEKQSRIDTVKSQINIAAQAVKALKEQLERQKIEVEGIITDQKLQQTAISERKRTQSDLMTKYQNNAEAYTAEAEEQRKIKESEIAAEIAKYNSVGSVATGTIGKIIDGAKVAAGVNSYPWQNQCPAANLSFMTVGGYVCQCTSYAGYKAQERWGITILSWGHAYSWANFAEDSGFRVDTSPAVHTVAVSTEGEWGHVMWVENVNEDGTIDLSEYNNWYSSRPNRMADFGYRTHVSPAGLQFVHFN